MIQHPPFFTASAFPATHGFFGRQGGVSSGLNAALNVGSSSGDTAANVAENQRRIADAFRLTPGKLVFCKQIHSTRVETVTTPWLPSMRPEADGLVTKEKNILLGVMTADCAPVLFHDAENQVIGAAHAGWKGALGGIMEATLDAMRALGAKDSTLHAVVGPCIQQASYEVGPEFPAPFLADDPASANFFAPAPRPRFFLFHLPGYVMYRIKKAGIGHVSALAMDTCRDEERFFSYRRRTLRNEAANGIQMSVIVLK
jgi:YfiH family protein